MALNPYTAIVSAIYLDEDSKPIHDHIVITNVKSFTEASNLAEAYYGEDLVSIKIELIDSIFLPISAEDAKRFIEGE